VKPGPIVDTHCHLGAYRDPVAVLKAAEAADISLVAVTEDPDEFRRLKTRLGNRSNVQVALGLHPLRAASFTLNDLARFFRFVPDTRWIGEVGLDFSRAGVTTKKEQLRVFDMVLTEAQPGHHPLTVHSRGAEKEAIQRLVEANLAAVLHWYTGPLTYIETALSAGLYFSVNPAMLRAKRFANLIAAIPRDRILLETDGPYAKTAGHPAGPGDLASLVTSLASAWDVSPGIAGDHLRGNYQRLLRAAG